MTAKIATIDLGSFNPGTRFTLSDDEIQDSTIGNCDLIHLDTTPHIEGVRVWPTLRRRGFGTTLINAVVKHTESKFRDAPPVTLDVFADNKVVICLYEKCGFVEAGRRGEMVEIIEMQYRRQNT